MIDLKVYFNGKIKNNEINRDLQKSEKKQRDEKLRSIPGPAEQYIHFWYTKSRPKY